MSIQFASIPSFSINPNETYHLIQLTSLTSNGNLNLDTSLDVDDDLLDNLGGRVQVNEALVNVHGEHIPGLGTLTVRGLTSGNLEVLGGKADRALDAEVLGLGTLNELGADLLERGDLARGQGDADLVDLLRKILEILIMHVARRSWERRTGPSPNPSFSGFW